MPHPRTAHPPPTRLLRATAVAATVGVVVALVGLASLLRPVTTPVQDCGTALGFLLDGRTNVFADPEDPPDGLTAEEVRESNERPCRERVAEAARPGGIAFVAGLLLAVVAFLVEAVARFASWLRRRHRLRTDGSGAGPGAPAPAAEPAPADAETAGPP